MRTISTLCFGTGSRLLGGALLLSLTACFGSDDKADDPAPGTTGVSDALHFAFKTPDWERNIDCSQLSLPFNDLSDTVALATASSASTNSTFYLTYPADSSALVRPAALRRYAIEEYRENEAVFELSHKVPVTLGSTGRLVSRAGLGADSYNEPVAVKYVGHDGNYAIFDIKGRYRMMMDEAGTTVAPRLVTGDYSFRLRTRRR